MNKNIKRTSLKSAGAKRREPKDIFLSKESIHKPDRILKNDNISKANKLFNPV
jgi:hypothetical protein